MITPSFKLIQDDCYLFVNIKAPYAKLSEVDVSVDENDFRFYCKPYYLRLNLPGKIVDNTETEHGTYDFDEKIFKFKFEKQTKNENFSGLDLLTKLLTPISSKSSNPTRPLIQEISETKNENEQEREETEDEDEDEWFIDQKVNDDEEINITAIKYGFAQTKFNIFAKLSSEYGLIIDLPDPDTTPIKERTQLRILNENEKFNSDHYLADFFDDTEMIENVILKYITDELYQNDDSDYTEKEIDCLKSLTKKQYLLDKQEKLYAYSGIIDIIFAYCYNNRINCGESNVESGWTIAKLSSTLSWFDTFTSLESTLVASFRRSLAFPLYRNWKLSQRVLKDLIKIMKNGRKCIIKTFIKIREIFIDGDCRYILNDLYINDYIVWLQYVNEDKIKKLASFIEKIKITKEMVDLDLECIELSGHLALEHEENQYISNEENSDDEERSTEPNNKEINEKETDPTKSNNLTYQIGLLNLEDDTCRKTKPKIVELN